MPKTRIGTSASRAGHADSFHVDFFGSSRKVGGANKGLGEAPKSYTRKEHESAINSIARRGQGAIAPCRIKGQRPLWGLGQRPNCSASDQSQGSRQQRCRQRSVPASNFALPQKRPKLLSPQDSVKNQFFAAKKALPRVTVPFTFYSPDNASESSCSAAERFVCSSIVLIPVMSWLE